MHHYVCYCAVWEAFGVEEGVGVRGCSVGEFPTKEDAGVAIHGRLWWDGGVELPHYYCFWVVKEVLSYAGERVIDVDGKVGELLRGTDS